MAESIQGQEQPPSYGRTSPSDREITTDYELHANSSNQNKDTFNDEYNNDRNDDNSNGISMTELIYCSSSYHAIAKPVMLTMILSSLAVVYINNEQTLQTGEEAMNEAYIVWSTDESSESIGKTLAVSLGNALIMVSGICAMTYVIVLLFRFRCMKLLIGYMILSSATLLGFLGGSLFEVAIYIYHVPLDNFTFFGLLYNFAVVGVIAIFWAEGVPTYITQGYLVVTSVILAWQLAHFDVWTTWSLLVMLALYDLCAVLTPCGPLKALVNLMSEDDSPEMPGLLYEAELPSDARRPGVSQRIRSQNAPKTSENVKNQKKPQVEIGRLNDELSEDESAASEISEDINESNDNHEQAATVEIPLAVALVYNLPIIAAPNFHHSGASSSPLLDIPEDPNPQQLRSMVIAQLPDSGGKVERIDNGMTYLERDRHGNPKRTLHVDREGKVFSEPCGDEDDFDEKPDNTIKLGLGDFIFYSVLVSKSAQYSFATFAACFLTVLAGLGFTLILLAVYHSALQHYL
eukprot:CAMPEP_0194187154 /NCGR_PEP_ID=MMETSP0154-20130528/49710_1 /TAXON_ID=1049557 /ORGANISM="Thalassiothrix antarctica, Strain L6-D1" /LENGTH=517 /DNA_ID=CAMNT_0038906671 /DNA_START=25 /DNA_END=1579 /DNA_ORIENTATION=+